MTPIQSHEVNGRLLRAAEEALIPGSTAHVQIVQAIREDHSNAAKKLIRDSEILGRVEREIDFECTRLEEYLNAAQVYSYRILLNQIIDEISPKTKDIIIGAGEKLSCRIIAGLLRDRVLSH
jgi:aspartate kinase